MKMLRYSANDEIRFGILEEDGTVRQMTSCPWDSMEESGRRRIWITFGCWRRSGSRD